MTKRLFLCLFALYSLVPADAQNLVSSQFLGSRSQVDLYLQFNSLPFIQYGAKFYRLSYTTPDVHGVTDTVTGLLAVPDKPNKIYPRLVYQHGTAGTRTGVPSINVLTNGEGQLGLLFAGLGYIALCPDYLGLGYGSRGFHPYVHAASEASTAMDMLRAASQFLSQQQIHTNDQLFVTGYSQGGHAAMALQRAIELDASHEFNLTAAAHMSGPYSISGVMRDLILSDDIYYYPAYIPNTALSYQTVYGNLFQHLDEVFRSPYAGLIAQFRDGVISLSDLNEMLIETLTSVEGSCRPFRMLQPAIVDSIMQNPQHPINQALADNDVYTGWSPSAPMQIFYCMNDDQVPFENSIVARDHFQTLGISNFGSQDVMPSADHGQCVTPAVTATLFFFLGYQQIGTVGTEALNRVEWLSVTPNPVSGRFHLENLPEAGILEVRDLQGKIVMTTRLEPGSHELDAALLPNGTYLLVWRHASGLSAGKLIVRH